MGDTMRKIRHFVDYLLYKDWDGEHLNRRYNTIYGKIIYPVTNNPLERNVQKCYFKTSNCRISMKGKYELVRGYL